MHTCIINMYSKLNRLKVTQNKNLYSYSYFVTLRMILIFFNSYINSYKIYNRITNINDMIIYRVLSNNNFSNFTFWILLKIKYLIMIYSIHFFFFAKKFIYFQINSSFVACLQNIHIRDRCITQTLKEIVKKIELQ